MFSNISYIYIDVVAGVNYFICSYIHYIEKLMNVPYRYAKKFKGEIQVMENHIKMNMNIMLDI